MLLSQEDPDPPSRPRHRVDIRLAAASLLLMVAAAFTLMTIQELSARREIRTELAEISHVRYGLLNADRWVEKIEPILDAKIDALDLTASGQATLRPAVENMLYRLLDQIKQKMSSKDSQGGLGALIGGNSLIANMMTEMLRPQVPQYADALLAELARPENKQAAKNYLKSLLAEGAKSTFGSLDMKAYSQFLQQRGCKDAAECQQVLGGQIREADSRITFDYLTVLAASALAFFLLMFRTPVLPRSSVIILMLVCVVLLLGGVLTPMIEVEAKISRLSMTFFGQPIAFSNQSLYFKSKSVLEVFQTLINTGKPDMWIVGVLVLMFSIVFPTMKTLTLGFCLWKPGLLRRSRLVRFLALESSKWSMADVMALAIFMSFVAFNGLVPNALNGLRQNGTELVIPTDSSKILPGYQLFIGFCLASSFLSKKLERGIRVAKQAD